MSGFTVKEIAGVTLGDMRVLEGLYWRKTKKRTDTYVHIRYIYTCIHQLCVRMYLCVHLR